MKIAHFVLIRLQTWPPQVIEDLPRMLPTKFRFIWPGGYRVEDSLEINQSETRSVNKHGHHRQFLFLIG
jgi:hypothetical protein